MTGNREIVITCGNCDGTTFKLHLSVRLGGALITRRAECTQCGVSDWWDDIERLREALEAAGLGNDRDLP